MQTHLYLHKENTDLPPDTRRGVGRCSLYEGTGAFA